MVAVTLCELQMSHTAQYLHHRGRKQPNSA